MKIKKLHILGEPYDVCLCDKGEADHCMGNDETGAIDYYAKQIFLRDMQENAQLEENPSEVISRPDVLQNIVLRHEIVHSFFFESGNYYNYGQDERLVDWIAIMAPKLIRAFYSADAFSEEEMAGFGKILEEAPKWQDMKDLTKTPQSQSAQGTTPAGFAVTKS